MVEVNVNVRVGVRVGTGVVVDVNVNVGMGVNVEPNSWPGPQPEAAKPMTNTKITEIFIFIFPPYGRPIQIVLRIKSSMSCQYALNKAGQVRQEQKCSYKTKGLKAENYPQPLHTDAMYPLLNKAFHSSLTY